MRLLLNEVGGLVMEGTKKAALLHNFFTSFFPAKTAPWESQSLETRAWAKEDFPLVKKDLIRGHLG